MNGHFRRQFSPIAGPNLAMLDQEYPKTYCIISSNPSKSKFKVTHVILSRLIQDTASLNSV